LVTAGLFVTALVVVVVLAKGLQIDQTKIPSTIIGKPAYPFRVDWIQGQEHLPNAGESSFRMEHLIGKPVVLNFWASWCVSCREEARELEAFWTKHKPDGVLVVGIAIQDTQEAAAKFAEYYGKTYLLGLDTDGKVSIDYGVTGVPETFIINRKGEVVHKEVGPVTAAMLEKYLPEIL
jgi:cytochrome c biogenesis protein CcmG/thiol:disulfide interchange protein DsbE